MKKTHKLFFSEEPDFAVLGIGSHVKGYKLCWHLNKKLQIELEKEEEKKEGLKYTYFDRLLKTEYNLFFNQIKKGYLLPEKKKYKLFFANKKPVLGKRKKRTYRKTKNNPRNIISFRISLKNKNTIIF